MATDMVAAWTVLAATACEVDHSSFDLLDPTDLNTYDVLVHDEAQNFFCVQ
jgi:hypothetical protein